MTEKSAGVIALILILAINVALAYAPSDIIDRKITSEKIINENIITRQSSTTTNETTTFKNASYEQSSTRGNQSKQVETNKTTEEKNREKREERIQDFKGIVHIASAFLGLFIVYDMFRPRKPPEPPDKKEGEEEPTKTVINIGGDYIGDISTVYKHRTEMSPEAVKSELEKTLSKKDAARLALSFKTTQEIDRMCNREAKTEEYLDKLLALKNYTEGFSDTFTKQVDEFSRFMKEEQLVTLR